MHKFLSFVILIIINISAFADLYIIPSPPSIDENVAYSIIDYSSKKVLISQHENEKRSIASLTKIMTAYVAFKRIKAGLISLDDTVFISKNARLAIGSRSFLEQGESIKLEHLLQAMIIQSGNDASIAIAEHIAGDEETFVKLMNHYAKELAMNNTKFQNSSGLPQKAQYSTAKDLALLSVALIAEFPKHYKTFSKKQFTYNNITQKNRNAMLWSDKTVDGIKTGHTEAAGYCLIISSKRNTMRLVSVVLGAKSKNARKQISKRLLDYSFRFFETRTIAKKYEQIISKKIYKSSKNSISIGLQQNANITIARGQFKIIKQTIKLPKKIIAPVKKGDKLGELSITLDNKEIANYDLVALENAHLAGFFSRIIDNIKLLF